MRTFYLIAAAALMIGLAGCVDSNSPKLEAGAVKAAQTWLALIDSEGYEAGWDAAATFFQEAVPKEQWVQTLTGLRKPLGSVISRKLKSATYHTSLKGAPEGQYFVIRFTSEFVNKAKIYETVTQMKEKDGLWRVAGYHLKPGSSHWLQDLMDK